MSGPRPAGSRAVEPGSEGAREIERLVNPPPKPVGAIQDVQWLRSVIGELRASLLQAASPNYVLMDRRTTEELLEVLESIVYGEAPTKALRLTRKPGRPRDLGLEIFKRVLAARYHQRCDDVGQADALEEVAEAFGVKTDYVRDAVTYANNLK